MRRHPLSAYVVLAFAITWLGVLPLVVGTSVPPALHLVGALGPVAAAFIVTMVVGGRQALRQLWRSTTRWRATPGWLAVTLLSPLALFALAAAISRPNLGPLTAWADDPYRLIDPLLISLAYGFGEEPGWRGFALPRLQARHSAFTATLILAGIWVAWHAPFFAYRYPFAGIGALAGFTTTLLAGALWFTFLYNSTGGSVLAVALWHALWDLLNISVGAVAQDTVMIANLLILALGVAVLWLGGWRHLRWAPHRRSHAGSA